MFYECFVQFKFSYWFEDCLFQSQISCNFITSTRSTIMSSIRVTVPTENQTVSINNLFSLLSARSDLSFIEGFNLVEIIEMIDYVSTSKTFTLCLKIVFIYLFKF